MGNKQVQDTAHYHSAILPEGESISLILFYKLGASASEWRRACSATGASPFWGVPVPGKHMTVD